ncbi:ABC transporter substrate-binding protein [Streptomyces sp. NPDC020875]|uniref:ABC transporter substrate-binding protein n=1 Tax=Streptomyces sp. NPDC020875 TaxID=3154898 RepID=UPI0034044057
MPNEELQSCRDTRHSMSTGAGADVQRRLEMLVRDFRSSHPPMPVVVLHAEDAPARTAAAAVGGADAPPDPAEQVVQLVRELHTSHDVHGSRCAVAADARAEPTEVRRAAGLVRDLGNPRRWDGRRAQYRRYSFPRVRLVHAIENAVNALAEDQPDPAPYNYPYAAQSLLDQLARQRWRPGGSSRWSDRLRLFDMAHILPMSLVAVVGALIARADWLIALASGVGFLLFLVLLDNVLPGRAPLFLWLRRESRWFLTTTFLRAASPGQPTDFSLVRPVRSWKAIAARAHEVAEALKTGDDFQLQLYVLALCEDLRDNHRRWSWDLRGFKRPRPPVLFIPKATAENGGIELIKAVSDVRSRRSELDPLLIVAAVQPTDVARLQRSVVQDADTSAWTWYQEWGRNLRAGQSPSRALAELPWVIKVPIRPDRLTTRDDGRHDCVRATARPTAARILWSVHALILVTALLAGAVAFRAHELADEFCDSSPLSANRDTERVETKGVRGAECIGIATGDVRFSNWLKRGNEPAESAASPSWTLATLEKLIREENKKVLENHSGNYVTIVYAGPLSSASPENASPVKGIEELAGVYVAQRAINEEKGLTRLRVLIANGGPDMRHQIDMAESIARYARRDPTLVGVVGIGRNLTTSKDVAAILKKAELPVISGTNSSTQLPTTHANWFSLAAPDEWQAAQLGLIARQLRDPAKKTEYALVLARDTENTPDEYTKQQARFGGEMLVREKFTPLKSETYKVGPGGANLREPSQKFCRGDKVPSVIYFAGRAEDASALTSALRDEQGCADKNISVLTGDDVSKEDFTPDGDGSMPSNVTLYHSTLAQLAEKGDTDFYENGKDYLPVSGDKNAWAGPKADALANGQTALSHDATWTLYRAASDSGVVQSRAATWVNLRAQKIPKMATGEIDFTTAPPKSERRGHSIVLNQVRRGEDGKPEIHELCARPAGNTTPLTVGECAIPAP